ncbi:hypothetical protein [Chitinophaga ginsengisoli]|uniref:Uncharacterized protein n=1 Tax=Chitinophaga ginsengisoli TaxID=363837 RepID=A0A2P8FQV2_9BACT|nr:hypothetical protein [Chitinophaga ginsengisoli]PSL24035.1 hypothetical protein CLV42_11621 [Chitinophaga ginsengisoli]
MSKKSRIKQLAVSKESRSVDNTHGSNLWTYNHFRTSILTSLLNDLIDLENDGLNEDICKVVRRSLEYFINASTNVPKGGFLSGGPLYLEIETFARTYKEWNDVDGKLPENVKQRREYLKKLRKQRQAITNKVRRLQFEIENNLDQKILADSYRAIGEIIGLVPNIFKNLTASYHTYMKAIAA